ncbi:MAG: alpha amylase C-terminal domain-containing protein [Hymenobacteraceae bacterium]|nr:alpha amylase C-terminal domain-containing protein [Hymenobacteraceae bacterium]
MGALPAPLGATFRVWAPAATAVAVSGSFSDWQPIDLFHEADGYWAADVPGALVGHEYKYQLLTASGETLHRNDPYAREVTASDGNSVVPDLYFDWGNDAFQMPPWNELVIYELHVGTFNPHDNNEPGTFYGVMGKLSYLQSLGVNAIEIMPPTEFPGGRSWGYNPAHPYALETSYGGPRAFKELVKAAHEHGIAVILDVVYNHFGPDHLPHWRFDGWYEGEGGGIYFYNDWRGETPWGHTRPDYGRPEVRQYIRDNALMWLDDYRMDGLRTDALAYIRNVYGSEDPNTELPDGWSLMQWLLEEIQDRAPWKITIAEDLKGNGFITRPPEVGGQGFSTQWDIGFAHTLRRVVTAALDEDRSMAELAQAIEHRYNDDAFQRVIYMESHDEVANGASRIPEQIMPGQAAHWFPKKRATLGAALALTAPGIPMLFQGQELLEDGEFADTRPLQWDRLLAFFGLVTLYRDLIALRRNLRGTTRGLTGQGCRVHHVNDEAKLVAFLRWSDGPEPTGPGDATLVVVNCSGTAFANYHLGLPVGGVWYVRFNSDWGGYDAEFGDFESLSFDAIAEEADGLPFSGHLGIGPYSVLILSQNPT